MEFVGSFAAMFFSSGQCLVILQLHAVQLGQYIFEFPAAWPFHVDLDIDELVVKPMEK